VGRINRQSRPKKKKVKYTSIPQRCIILCRLVKSKIDNPTTFSPSERNGNRKRESHDDQERQGEELSLLLLRRKNSCEDIHHDVYDDTKKDNDNVDGCGNDAIVLVIVTTEAKSWNGGRIFRYCH
jgi:hypothetical protein